MPISVSGVQGLLVGPAVDDPPISGERLSTAWQPVTLPEDVTTLSFQYWPQTGPNAGDDQQYAGLVGQDGEIITLFFTILENSETWQTITADLSPYAGQTLWVYFGTQNDGVGDSTRLIVDEVTLCNASAAVPPPTTTTATPDSPELAVPAATQNDVYTFEQLNFAESVLGGPFDNATYRLGLPSSWELVAGTALDLHLTMLGTLEGLTDAHTPDPATLNLLFNDVLLETTVLQIGQELRISVTIPPAALAGRPLGKRHELELVLDSSHSCGVDQTVSLLIHPDSTFTLPHKITPPEIDLRLFPQPIFSE